MLDMNLFSIQMRMGPKCNAAMQSIFIICVICTLMFHTDCSDTEKITCEPALCQHGICYRTTKSIKAGGEIDNDMMQCPDGFDKYKAFCFRVDRVKQSWLHANEHSEENGILATFFEKEDANTAAEYLRSKLADDHVPVWANLLFNEANALPNHQPPCTALEQANYTQWKMHDCDSELYSLRSDTLSNPTPTYDIICRCHHGYTGISCDTSDTKLTTQELTNPDVLQCPRDTLIFVEFALDGYEANNTTGVDRFATSTLAILRSACQGKNKCNLQPFKTETAFYNKPSNATLTIRHSCVKAHDMYCHSSEFKKEDGNSVNCILPMYRNVSWDAAYYYCFQKGGHLAAFNSGIQCVNSIGISRILHHSTSFWTYDDLPDDGGQAELATASINHIQSKTSSLAVAKQCPHQLPGICVIPPFHQGNIVMHPSNALALAGDIDGDGDADELYGLFGLIPAGGIIWLLVKKYCS